MKKILSLLSVMLLCLCSCDNKPNSNSGNDNGKIDPTTVSEAIEAESTTDAAKQETTADKQEAAAVEQSGTIDPFSPDECTLKELTDIFGEPQWISKYTTERGPYSGGTIMTVMFNNAMYDLYADSSTDLHLAYRGNGNYNATEATMPIKLKPTGMSILKGKMVLPGGVTLGDPLDAIYEAYNNDHGSERQAEGQLLVSYDSDTAEIIYHFPAPTSEGSAGDLVQFTLAFKWFGY